MHVYVKTRKRMCRTEKCRCLFLKQIVLIINKFVEQIIVHTKYGLVIYEKLIKCNTLIIMNAHFFFQGKNWNFITKSKMCFVLHRNTKVQKDASNSNSRNGHFALKLMSYTPTLSNFFILVFFFFIKSELSSWTVAVYILTWKGLWKQ